MENIEKEILERIEKNEMEKKMREEYIDNLLSKMKTAEETHNEVMNCFHFLDNIYDTVESPEKVDELKEKLNIFISFFYNNKKFPFLNNNIISIYRDTIGSIFDVFVHCVFIRKSDDEIKFLNTIEYFYKKQFFKDDIEFLQRILDNKGIQCHVVRKLIYNVIRLSEIKP